MVKRQAEIKLPTNWGDFRMIAYSDTSSELMPHLAIIHKDANVDAPIYLRMHSECLTGDLFSSKRCDCHEQFIKSMELISEHKGILIYLRQEGRGIGLINKMKAYNLQDKGVNTIDANLDLGLEVDTRKYDTATTILEDLKIHKVHLLTNNPLKLEFIEKSSIQIVSRIPIIIQPNEYNKNYLATKRNIMGHLINAV